MPFNKILLFLFIFPLYLSALDTIPPQVHIKAPVVLKGDTLFYFKSSAHTFPIEVRAEEASFRLQRLTAEYNPLTDSLWLKQEPEFIKIMFNEDFALVTTQKDAENDNTSIPKLAKLRLERVHSVLNK